MYDVDPVLSRVGPGLFFHIDEEGRTRVGQCAGVVYVAYLDEEGRLIAAYPVSVAPGVDPLEVVARDARHQVQRSQVLVGFPAELLFVGITGRRLGRSPEQANPWLARVARQLLADNIDHPDCAVALAATIHFGSFIEPWYGSALLDQQGGLVLDDPRYSETIDIPLVLASEANDGRLSAGSEWVGSGGGVGAGGGRFSTP